MDGRRLTRIVRWVADTDRLEWSDKVRNQGPPLNFIIVLQLPFWLLLLSAPLI